MHHRFCCSAAETRLHVIRLKIQRILNQLVSLSAGKVGRSAAIFCIALARFRPSIDRARAVLRRAYSLSCCVSRGCHDGDRSRTSKPRPSAACGRMRGDGPCRRRPERQGALADFGAIVGAACRARRPCGRSSSQRRRQGAAEEGLAASSVTGVLSHRAAAALLPPGLPRVSNFPLDLQTTACRR